MQESSVRRWAVVAVGRRFWLDRPSHDPDRLLAGYGAARAQDTLFDLRGGAARFGGTGYDEFVDATGTVRPSWQELGDLIGERGRAGLERLRGVVRGLVDNDGITYIELDHDGEAVTNGEGIAMPGPWHLDGIPLLLSASDWETLEAGVVQRSRSWTPY